MRASALVGLFISLSVAEVATAGPVHVMVADSSPALVEIDGVGVSFPPGQSGPVEASEVSVGAAGFPVSQWGGFLHVAGSATYFPAHPDPDRLLSSVVLCLLFGGLLFQAFQLGYKL